MSMQPFTPVGVANKMADLYALSDPALLIEADAIRADFRDWVSTNFILDATQQTRLADLNDKWVQIAACQLGFAVENRLPVTLEVDPPPVENTTSGTFKIMASKLIGFESKIESTDDAGGMNATGWVRFYTVYTP
ncbi:hypothetical protein [Parapedobacter sp. 10938]|uniref:hypothetical protein n=1 Tax=Parapedobacter flavus TaxID=3110225 RepID=UPI002DB7C7AB|nr:hypothetical protein [Parapedobacter sp. 10938]MEC3880217.1 hypothetical protein [Parapedobacter sp. 10938]